MKRLLLLTLCLGSTLFVAGTLSAVKGGPPRNWSMTIDNTLSDGVTATTILSDGLGDYTNGVDGVGMSSTFLNFWPRTDLGTRNVRFGNNGFLEPTTLAAPVVNDTDTPPTGLTGTGLQLTDPHGALTLPTPMENMSIASRQCASLFLVAADSNTESGWRMPNYQYSNASGSGTSFVVVKRISATQWTVESDYQNFCTTTNYPNEAMVLHGVSSTIKGKTTTITHADGYYSIPFHFTYTLD